MSVTINGQEIEVKPCPFCGSEDVRHDSAMGFPYLFCAKCDAYGPPAQSDAHAVEAWNRRENP